MKAKKPYNPPLYKKFKTVLGYFTDWYHEFRFKKPREPLDLENNNNIQNQEPFEFNEDDLESVQSNEIEAIQRENENREKLEKATKDKELKELREKELKNELIIRNNNEQAIILRKNLEEMFDKLAAERENYDKRKEITEENKELKEQNTIQKEKINELSQIIEELKQKNIEISTDDSNNSSLEKKVLHLERINGELTEKLKKLTQENEKIVRKHEKLENERNKMLKTIEEQKETNQILSDKTRKYDKLETEVQEQKEENNILSQKNQKIHDKYNNLKAKNQSLTSEYTEVIEKYEKLEQKYQKAKSKRNESNEQKAKEQDKPVATNISDFYDIVINIDSLKAQEVGWEILSNHLKKSQKDASYSVVGFVGRENVGKTFILNKICGFDLPSGSTINTKGLSLKYAERNSVLCLDSSGIQTPVYYFDDKVLRRFSVEKKDLLVNDEIRREIINDRIITDVFLQDFILDVCGVIVIVVGQLSQNDQKFIERIRKKYQAKKRIIIVHNFFDIDSMENVLKKVEKDIGLGFDTVARMIPNAGDENVNEYIEKMNDKERENISHLVLGNENSESGERFNKWTIEYLRDILDTNVEKRKFNIFNELSSFFEENYRLYIQFKTPPKGPLSIKVNPEKSLMKIDTTDSYEVTNPIFNSLGGLVTNPPYEIFEKQDRYICSIELSQVLRKSLVLSIDKKKTEFNCLIVKGQRYLNNKDNTLNDCVRYHGTRNLGEFMCMIPLGSNALKVIIDKNSIHYQDGVLSLEVIIREDSIIRL